MSTDRSCPEFLRRCAELDSRFPENRMPYFPTDNPLTWITAPPKQAPKPASELTRPLTTPLPFPILQSLSQPPPPRTEPTRPQPPTQRTQASSRAPSRMGNLDDFGFTSQQGGPKNSGGEVSSSPLN
ncbi:hypothetical protein C0989_000433 [Termitomyces sp. Mn162]|nr:hypothetical protein C0989_000433 [Termitomyces sp. Mn162]